MTELRAIFVAALAALLLRCSQGPKVAGGTDTDSGGTVVAGLAVDGTGKPVASAVVRLRPAGYVRDAAGAGLSKTAIYSADAVTDAQGRFLIEGVDSGNYLIEITDGVSTAALLNCALARGDSADLGVAVMRPFAVMRGTADTSGRGPGQLFAQVRGLERLAPVGADGSFMFNNLPAGALGLRICALDSLAYAPRSVYGIPVFSAETATVAMTLPGPWQSGGINETPLGSVALVNNTFVITGGGPDIWDTADGFHFVYQAWNGDVSMVARVEQMDHADGNAKACLMIRENLTGTSPFAAEEMEPPGLPVQPAASAEQYGSAYFHWRASVGDTTPYVSQGPPVLFPRWIKLERRGNTFIGFNSEDGINWAVEDSVNVTLPADVYVGLAVTSHTIDKLCTAEFDSVTIGP